MLKWMVVATLLPWGAGSMAQADLNEDVVGRFAQLALDCVDREYPNKISHVMQGPGDAKTPRQLHPSFFGCFDWHSSVHGHWLLARLLRLYPDHPLASRMDAALNNALQPDPIAGEVAYFESEGRAAYERPYGLAWLLQLSAELRTWDDDRGRRWSEALAPLETVVAQRFRDWLPKLAYPIRTGEHSQTAFAFGLVLDWAAATGDTAMTELVTAKCREFYLNDRGCNLAFEPSGQDFLSPCLAEADLMRRILDPATFAAWLGRFLPDIPFDGGSDWLPLGVVTDAADGKLAHLDGLNLARAWMLDGIAAALPPNDPRIAALQAARDTHQISGLAAVTGAHYEGGHWLGSFAVYLLTRRGLSSANP